MKTSLQTFQAGIEELDAFLVGTDTEAELIRQLLQPERRAVLLEPETEFLSKIAAARTDRKRYLYAVAIVSLYGLFERFVDSCIEAFVSRVASLAGTYEKLPDVIRRNHTALSLELLKALIEERHREAITQEQVITNLYSCISGVQKCTLNGAAFVLHRGNITLHKITSFLGNIGIDAHLRRVTYTREFGKYFSTLDPDRDIRQVADQDLPALLEPIDDLVDRRNLVSHGVISVDDIESVDLLRERCRFISAYVRALYDVLTQEVLRYLVKAEAAKPLGKPIAAYGNAVVCFERGDFAISVGDLVVAATGNPMEPFRYGAIQSLEVDRVRHASLSVSTPIQFGVAVPFRAIEQYDYYLLTGVSL